MNHILRAAFAGAVLGLIAVLPAAHGIAAENQEVASPWSEGLNSEVRLVAGAVEGSDMRYAGIEIRLEDGWKTYWRNPGDAGIPPVFDWSGSENLANAEVLYPVPQRLDDPAGTSIGYKGGVMFPVRITANEQDKPVLLNLKLNYAVCAELCIPADAAIFLAIPAGEGGAMPSAPLARSLARVPVPAGDGPPRVSEVSLEGEGKARHLAMTVAHASGTPAPELFIEGPEHWYIGVPEETARINKGGGLAVTYKVPVRGRIEPGETSGTALRATIDTGAGAVEQRVKLP